MQIYKCELSIIFLLIRRFEIENTGCKMKARVIECPADLAVYMYIEHTHVTVDFSLCTHKQVKSQIIKNNSLI